MNSIPNSNEAGLRLAAAAVCSFAVSAAAAEPAKPSHPPRGFVRLADLAPKIIQDMRYASADNFTGAKVPGYRAGQCILATPVARALARVEADLQQRGYGLKVFDCYRPKRAVAAFVRWARADTVAVDTAHYFPTLTRPETISKGYISTRSSHSRGTAIDLTLVRLDARGVSQNVVLKAEDGRRQKDCSDPGRAKPRDGELDMGTAFDCFDRLSWTHAGGISKAARANRLVLLDAMERRGFRNYRREWWHFWMPLDAYRARRDFPVE